ncbi:MAG: glutathione synthase [Cyanobacteria bacterium P01_F01_bin.42]
MKLAFIIDPIEALDPGHDTSVALMEAACAAGHQVWVTDIYRLRVKESRAWALLTPVQIYPVKLVDDRWIPPYPWYKAEEPQDLSLDSMDVIWMRQDPPVTIPYLYATYILDYVDLSQTLVVNAPQGIRAANEKMYALQFDAVIPRTIVAQEKTQILEFVEREKAAVLKPLGGKAGEGILFLEAGDKNLNSMIEISTLRGRLPVMVQEYLPAAKAGDKRIILMDGDPIGAVNRIPVGREFRGNMATGGRVEAAEVTARDRFICEQVKPELERDGLIFVGIDVIGDYLTEVNVTSPTGIREVDRLSNLSLGQVVVDWLANRKALRS